MRGSEYLSAITGNSEVIPSPKSASLERVVHNAHRIELRGGRNRSAWAQTRRRLRTSLLLNSIPNDGKFRGKKKTVEYLIDLNLVGNTNSFTSTELRIFLNRCVHKPSVRIGTGFITRRKSGIRPSEPFAHIGESSA
jgi:hypothetical protein